MGNKLEELPLIRDITYKTPENFFGHLVALDHEIGGISARSVHLKSMGKVDFQC